MDSENIILSKSLRDLLSAKMLKYSLLPFLLSVVILYILFFVLAGVGLDQLTGTMDVQTSQTTIENGMAQTQSFSTTLQNTAIIQFLMSSALTSWIASFLVYTIGTFLTLYASIFVAVIVIGFLTPMILKEIQKRHYPDVKMVGHASMIESIVHPIKWIAVMLFLFIAFIPLYFIPLVNIIAFNLPLYYFFHKMITYDVSSNICTKEEAFEINSRYANVLRLKTLALYLISLIPFMILFASVFFVIYLGHSYFLEVRKLRYQA